MKNAIFAICGFVAGATIGSLVTYKILNKKYDENFEQEVADVREAYTKKLVDFYNQKEEEANEEFDEPSVKLNRKKEKYVKPEYHDYTQHANKADPSVIAAKPELSSLVREVTSEEGTYLYSDGEEVDAANPVYSVDEETFELNTDKYEKIELEYFIDDDALIDDKEDLISEEDRDRVLPGIDLLEWEKYKESKDSGSIFVVNHTMNVYFEILLNPSSYRKEILGVDDDFDLEDIRPRREAIRKPRKLGDE